MYDLSIHASPSIFITCFYRVHLILRLIEFYPEIGSLYKMLTLSHYASRQTKHLILYVVKDQKWDIVGMRKQGLDDNRERVNVILQLTAELSVGDGQTTKHLTAIDLFCNLGEKKQY